MEIYIVLFQKVDLYYGGSATQPEIETECYVQDIFYSRAEAEKYVHNAGSMTKPFLFVDGPHWAGNS